MNYGLYISASGAASAMYRMDVAANNLSNINTVGFKPDRTVARQREAVRPEDGAWSLPSNVLLERLGGGVHMHPNRVSFEQGPIVTTNGELDLAIQGPGFLVARDETDKVGDRVRLTRDGRLSRNGRGQLVTAGDGKPILDVNNRAIQLPEGGVAIGGDGSIRHKGQVVAQIQFIDVPDTARLIKIGHGMFQAPADALENRRAATGTLRQGQLEGAAIDPIQAMLAVKNAAGDADRNLGMIRHHDTLMDRAINTLGRVA